MNDWNRLARDARLIDSLETEIVALVARHEAAEKSYYERNAVLLIRVEELETERNLAWDKGYNKGRDDAHETIKALKAELNTVIYQNAEAENTIIKLRAEINKLKTSDKVFTETYDELMKVQAANHALHALENDKILELKGINADLRLKIDELEVRNADTNTRL